VKAIYDEFDKIEVEEMGFEQIIKFIEMHYKIRLQYDYDAKKLIIEYIDN
jgi:hypothetical protein